MSNSALVSYTKLSPNHSGKRTHKIDRITPHCVVGQLSAESIAGCFVSQSKQASCNYGIGSDGKVCMVVEECNRSWCSSSNSNDQRAVTIECASDKTEPYAFTDTVYNKLVELCVDICKRNGKKKLLWLGDKDKTLEYEPASDEMVLTVHRWFKNKSCPGDWLYARLGNLATTVTNQLGGKNDSGSNNAENTSFPEIPFTVQVIVSDLNYRSSGSMDGAILGQTGKGTFTITEVSNGWGKLKSGAGWIYLENSSYVTIGSTVTNASAKSSTTSFSSYKVKVTADALRIRKGPGTGYGINGVIRDKGVYTIIEESSGAGSNKGWGKLKSGAGWIALDHCTRV